MVALLVRGLPRGVYVLQAGLVINAFGNGAANPFMLLYLHEVRGIPLAVAGIASGVGACAGLAAALAAGSLADRVGGRATVVGGLALSTLGFLLYPLVREGWQAIALAVLLGLGTGTWLTGQSTLLARLVDSPQRPLAFAQQRVAANVGLGLGGAVGGLLVTTTEPETFTTLFLLNAATFVVYAGFLVRVPEPPAISAQAAGGGSYRAALADTAFLRLLAVSYAFVAGAVSLLVGVFPVYARTEAGVSEDVIGMLFLVNSLLIIGLQVRIARGQGGRRRMVALAHMGVLFACSWLLVLVAGLGSAYTVLVLLLAIGVFSLAECLYDAVQGPIVADLAPEGLVGRYMALNGFSWQLGFITGPAVAAAVLGAEPHAVWLLGAGVCLLGALGAYRLERRLPADVVSTPVSVPS